MAHGAYDRLSRRERQIMDIIYQHGQATAAELEERMPDPPSNAAVRAKLRVLEEKGYLTHVQDGPRYVYLPLLRPEQARQGALDHVVRTFFAGSITETVAALLQLHGNGPSDEDLDRLARLVDRHRVEEA